MFTKEELKEIKYSLNSLIKDRLEYLNSSLSAKEVRYTEEKLDYDYNLLGKVLKLIENVEG